RWLENLKDKDVEAWFKAQAEMTDDLLAKSQEGMPWHRSGWPWTSSNPRPTRTFAMNMGVSSISPPNQLVHSRLAKEPRSRQSSANPLRNSSISSLDYRGQTYYSSLGNRGVNP